MLTDQQIRDLEDADLRSREAKALYENARLIREREIRRVAAEGGTYREIAKATGVAYQRVAQIVTGREPVSREPNDYLQFECPTCGAQAGEVCDGKRVFQAHAERHDVAIAAFRERNPQQG